MTEELYRVGVGQRAPHRLVAVSLVGLSSWLAG